MPDSIASIKKIGLAIVTVRNLHLFVNEQLP